MDLRYLYEKTYKVSTVHATLLEYTRIAVLLIVDRARMIKI